MAIKGWDGRGAHSGGGSSASGDRDRMMARFKAEMKALRYRRVVDDYFASPLEVRRGKGNAQTTDYPWLKPGWKW